MNKEIKFNIPFYGKEEHKNIMEYLEKNRDFKTLVAKHIKNTTSAASVLLASGATSAMDAFFAGANLPQGSEVIIPSFTFPSAANVVLRAGLIPVFADIDIKTLVMDISDVKKKITAKTSCIMPVHYGGVSMDMDVLVQILDGQDICIFEDAALAYGGFYKNRHLGTIGEAGVMSFHSTKNISGDGGGALLVNNSDDEELYSNILANGTDKLAFLRGDVSEYSWQTTGAGAEMSGLTSALLYSQLKKDIEINSKRETLWNGYMTNLKSTKIEDFASLPEIPEYNTNNYHVFYVMFKEASFRENIRTELVSDGIQAYIHYKPLHSAAMGHKLGYTDTELPVTRKASDCILRLPLHMHMDLTDVEYVCEKLLAAVNNAS